MPTNTTSGITLAEANRQITNLSRLPVPTFSGLEDLDRPLDGDILVTPGDGRWSISLLVDGQPASGCQVIDHAQQIGPCLLRMAGIAGVYTGNAYRFRGYSRRVLENTLRWMRSEGFDVSMLYGISGFYPKFGFANAFPEVKYSLALRDAELAAGKRCRFVDYGPENHKAVLALYHQVNAGRNGVTRRDLQHWHRFRQEEGYHWGPQIAVKVALDAKGNPAGYFVYDEKAEATILEIGWASPAIFPDLLRAMVELAWASRVDKITFHLPEDDAFMRFCQPLGFQKEISYRRDGGPMIRMININHALQAVAPLLATRVSGHGFLTIRTNLDRVGLVWSGSELAVVAPRETGDRVELPQWALSQLLFGYHSADSPAFNGIVKGTKRGLAALACLFPQTPHYHYRVDAF